MAYTTINKSTAQFNTKLYTGDGTTSNTITGIGFQSDMAWFKARSTTDSHFLTDSVRGITKYIRPSAPNAEETETTAITSLTSDGYVLSTAGNVNDNNVTYASWNWKAGGTASSNTNGSITSSVSANTTAGFSVVKYTGTGGTKTIGHGLNSAPEMILQKNTNSTANWYSWHKGIPIANYIKLDQTTASSSSDSGGNGWNNTLPTNQVFSVGNDGGVNASGNTHIAYCFHSVKGYSKVGSYVGNSNADGTFVYTGFKPAFVLLKSSTSVEEWVMFDNKRLGYNPDNNALIASSNSAEATDNDIDFLSNGFKLRRNTGYVNDNGETFIYMAFGQSIVGSNDVPATAR